MASIRKLKANIGSKLKAQSRKERIHRPDEIRATKISLGRQRTRRAQSKE
jgi:hypothetical protein